MDDDNVSHVSRASETYNEVKDLLNGIFRTSQQQVVTVTNQSNHNQAPDNSYAAPSTTTLRAPIEQRRTNRHQHVDSSYRGDGSPSPDKRLILASSPFPDTVVGGSNGSNNGFSPGRASDFDRVLAAQALA